MNLLLLVRFRRQPYEGLESPILRQTLCKVPGLQVLMQLDSR